MKKTLILFVLLSVCLSLISAAGQQEAAFPSRPIEFYVASAAGGGSDLIARALANEMKLSKSVVVVNKGGAGGTIGTTEVAKSVPDGHTMLLGMVGPFQTQPHLNKLQYTVDDFRHISVLTYEPLYLIVPTSTGWNTVEDMKQGVLKLGRQLKYGSSGAGSVPHLAQAILYKQMGIAAEHVPFEGANPAVMALLGGHIDCISAHMGEVISHVKSGSVKVIGIYSPERFELAPDVATLKEQGYDIDISAIKFVSVPKDVPDATVAILVDAIKKAKDTPAFKEFVKANYSGPSDMTEAEIMEYLKRGSEQYKVIIKESGLGAL
jgi:tripartite-type tricarboxylate transporter receptor subunit TctC